MSFFVADLSGGYGADVVANAMRTFFVTLPDVDYVVALSPESVGMFTPLDSGDSFTVPSIVNRSTTGGSRGGVPVHGFGCVPSDVAGHDGWRSGLRVCPLDCCADAHKALDPSESLRTTVVLLCYRESFVPTLGIRRAAVEDHDDLVPIFNSQSEVLTEHFGEFFLAELIEKQVWHVALAAWQWQ